MKKIILSFFLALCAISAVTAKTKTVVWHEPQAIYKSNAIFHITSVEMKPEETVIHVHIKFQPKYWIRFDSNCYLLTDSGDKYAILSGTPTAPDESSMPLSDYFWMPESGEVNVALHFQPLPADIDCFHFVEPVDNGWEWWNIRDTKANYRSPIPADWQKLNYADDEVLPDAKIQKGVATVKVRLLGYKPEMKFQLGVRYRRQFTSREDFEKEYVFNNDGTLTAEVPLYMTREVNIYISTPEIYFSALLSPGEATECLIDLNRLDEPFVGFKGFLARTNYQLQQPEKGAAKDVEKSRRNAMKLREEILSCKSELQRLQFFKKRLQKWLTYTNKRKDRTSAFKALRRMMSEEDYLSWTHAFASQWADLSFSTTSWSIESYEQYDSLFQRFYHEGHEMLRPTYAMNYEGERELVRDMEIVKASYASVVPEFWRVPLPERYMSGLNRDLRELVNEIRENRAVERQKTIGECIVDETIDGEAPYVIKSPAVLAVLEEFKAEQERIRQQLAAQGNVFYQQLDSVPPSDILQTILDRYKGKPVLLDIWATWCGPCRAGHQQLAPLKEEMQKRGVQFIYITSPSSPIATWQTMIKDIPGDHYYLTQEQENHLMKLYASDGIPTYAIYDRDGNRAYFHIGLPSADDTNEIRRVLEDTLNKPTYTGSLVVGKDTITVQNAHHEP